MGNPVVDEDARSPDDLWLFAFRKHDALRRVLGAQNDSAQDATRAPEARLEALTIFVELDELTRDPGGHGRPRDGWRHPEQHARVEREGDDVLGSELHRLESIESG